MYFIEKDYVIKINKDGIWLVKKMTEVFIFNKVLRLVHAVFDMPHILWVYSNWIDNILIQFISLNSRLNSITENLVSTVNTLMY